MSQLMPMKSNIRELSAEETSAVAGGSGINFGDIADAAGQGFADGAASGLRSGSLGGVIGGAIVGGLSAGAREAAGQAGVTDFTLS